MASALVAPTPVSPTLGQRASSILVDGVAYVIVAIVLWILADSVLSAVLPPPPPSGDPRTAATLFGEGVAILGANFLLALGNALGTSPGRAMTGTRLVAESGAALVRPGIRRGLVRATLQWFPLPRTHLAGTRLVTVAGQDWKSLPPRAPAPPRMAMWIVVLAVSAQCLFAFCLMIASAL